VADATARCIGGGGVRLPAHRCDPEGDRRLPPSRADDPGLLQLEEDRAFFARLQHLPPQQRAVLVLRYYLDFDDRRIAGVLGVSRATVRSNAMRGLDKLRAALSTSAEER
jgi:RNA polymerase sigma factor (sigma-70 family)